MQRSFRVKNYLKVVVIWFLASSLLAVVTYLTDTEVSVYGHFVVLAFTLLFIEVVEVERGLSG